MPDEIELDNFQKQSANLQADGSMSLTFTPSRLASIDNLNAQNVPWQHISVRWKIVSFFTAWWNGPATPRDDPPAAIHSLQFLENIPHKFRQKLSTPRRLTVLLVYLTLWLTLWSKLLLPYLSETPQVSGTNTEVISLTCGQANQFWRGKNAKCGLDGGECPSLDTQKDVIFRCPALCDRGLWLYSLRAVGDQIIKYRGFFIGGGAKRDKSALSLPYRADSFPCGAAVHAGVVSPFFGGCAKISYNSGSQSSFKLAKGHYGVSDSVGFGGAFPFSYYFKELASQVTLCYDPRLLVLILNILLGIPVVFLASGATFYWVMAIVGFWTIVLATDPPILVEPQDPQSFYELILLSLERFLPACFVLFCLWAVSVKRTFGEPARYTELPSEIPAVRLNSSRDFAIEEDDELDELDDPENQRRNEEIFPGQYKNVPFSPLARLILWYPLFWLGVLNNITFDRLPVDRLTWHDLQVQPGALLTVMIVGSVLVCCIVAQAYYVWLSGRFWKLITVYALMFLLLVFFANLPGLSLRIHHYIFAIMFIPGCSTRGKTAIAFQGILLGLFLSGVARWGFASIAETNLSLLRGEPLGEIYAPQFLNVSDGVLYWKDHELRNLTHFQQEHLAKFTDISLLVNDVERYTGPNEEQLNLTRLFEDNEKLQNLLRVSTEKNGDSTLFLRMAKYAPEDHEYGDYNRASTLKYPSFNFTVGPPGIT